MRSEYGGVYHADSTRASLELCALDTDCSPTMPPVQLVGDIPGMVGSSLFLDRRDVSQSSPDPVPVEEHNLLLAPRSASTTHVSPGKGAIPPQDVNMHVIQAVFAVIGAGFVLGAIWFFFWAKNGGFVWRKGDWDEYKSTVLRRKGPDGRTLSNATKSTKLGGGSVVGRGYSDYDDAWTVTDSAAMTETATEVTEEKPRKKRNLKETAKMKLLRRRKEEKWEGEADEDVRAYRREKPARVGGLNQEPEGTYHGSDYTPTAPSEYNSSEMTESRDFAYRQEQRRNRNPSGFSFEAGSEDVLSRAAPEEYSRRDRDRHSTRRQHRRRERRDGERSRAHPSSRHSSPRKRERSSVGNYHEPLDFSSAPSYSEYQYSAAETEETGTKSYHHPLPALSKGYRRDGRSRRRDSLSDSDGEYSRRR